MSETVLVLSIIASICGGGQQPAPTPNTVESRAKCVSTLHKCLTYTRAGYSDKVEFCTKELLEKK